MDEVKYTGYETEVVYVNEKKSDAESVCKLGAQLLEDGCYAFKIYSSDTLMLWIDVFANRGGGRYSTIGEDNTVAWKKYGVDESFWKAFEDEYVLEDHSDDGYYIFKDEAIKRFGLTVEDKTND